MKKILLAVCLVLLTGGHSFAASLVDFNYLNGIKAYTLETGISFSLDFKKPVANYSGPIFYEKSIQIDFPKAYLHPARRKFQINDELIQEVLAYQFSENIVRVRLVLARSEYDLDKNFTIKNEGSKVVFFLKKYSSDPLERLLQTSVPAAEPEKISKTEEKHDLVTTTSKLAQEGKEDFSGSVSLPSALFESLNAPAAEPDLKKNEKSEKPIELSSGENAPDLFSASVKIYGMLFVVLALIFGIFYFVKNYLFQGNWMLSKEKLIDVIATNHIGAKKAISLVDVAGELLVIGVSNNQISMLTRVEDSEVIRKLRDHKARFQKTSPLGGFKFPFAFKKKNNTTSKPELDFSDQLRKFSSDAPEPEFSETGHSAADVTRLIQQKLEKVKKEEKIGLYAENAGKY